jgi:hypothetical protein
LNKEFLSKIPKFAQLNIEFNSLEFRNKTASTAYLATAEDKKSATLHIE